MIKTLRKCVSIFIAFALCFSMTVTAIAATPGNYNEVVLHDDVDVKIVQTSDENFIYTATYDKQTKTVQLTQTDKGSGEIREGDIVPVQLTQTHASLEEKTFTNYEYEITYGSPNKWELRRPGDNAFNWVYFQTYQTSSSKSYLEKFKDAVDDINVQEGAIIGAVGMSGLSVLAAAAAGAGAIFTGGTLSAAAWAAIVSAAGFGTAVVAKCMEYDQSCKDAYDAYWNTYYNSTIL